MNTVEGHERASSPGKGDSPANGGAEPAWRPEFYRGYLRTLAEVELGGRLRRRVDPSDIVQETLLSAHRASASPEVQELLGDERRTAAWLRRILANTLSNFLRDQRAARRDFRRDRSLEHALGDSSSRIESLLANRGESPSSRAASAEQLCLVVAALDRLPEDQRYAILLQRVADLPIAEVARELGRSPDSVAGLIRRGLARLRGSLDEER